MYKKSYSVTERMTERLSVSCVFYYFSRYGVGGAAGDAILATLARLQTNRHQHFPHFLKELGMHSGLDILILSCYDNGEIRQAMQELEGRGNRVTFHLLEGGSL